MSPEEKAALEQAEICLSLAREVVCEGKLMETPPLPVHERAILAGGLREQAFTWMEIARMYGEDTKQAKEELTEEKISLVGVDAAEERIKELRLQAWERGDLPSEAQMRRYDRSRRHDHDSKAENDG